MRIVVMPGDDIGPEITAVTMTMLEAVNRTHALGMVFETVDVGMASFRKCGNTIPESAVEAALAADGVILPHRSESGRSYPPPKNRSPPASAGGPGQRPHPVRQTTTRYP